MENVLPYNRFSLEVSLELLKSMDSQVNLHSARVCVWGGAGKEVGVSLGV